MSWEEGLFVGAAVGVFVAPLVGKRIKAWRDERRSRKLQERARVALLAHAEQLREFGRSMVEDDDEDLAGSILLDPHIARHWKPPIPAGAKHMLWEDIHTFAPGGKPKRDPYYGLHGGDPPMSLKCPMCECEQAPMQISGQSRKCTYCGLTLKAFGTRIFWWRDQTSAALEWRP